MKPNRKHIGPTTGRILAVMMAVAFLSACATVDPAKVDVKLEQKAPEVKITSYSQALNDLGLMTEIFDTGALKIQSEDISDNTGTSATTGGEIQRNITEIIKSTLNSIGGNVIFIEYDPAFIQNSMVTGYSNFENKLIPDVVITGGITEFDRGLETRGKGTDVGADAEFGGLADWLPSKAAGVRYGTQDKINKARITLDFNLKNFQTLAGIARMNTVNSIEVSKGLGKTELGVTLFGATFGRKGSVKKVQGRHEAVRLLVQVSMIQMTGKYLVLPYWRLLGDDAQPDKVVLSSLKRSFYGMAPGQRNGLVQEWLYLHGHDVSISGQLDETTLKALQTVKPGFQPTAEGVDLDTFIDLYVTIPIDELTLARRQTVSAYYASLQQQQAAAAPAAQQAAPAQAQPAQTTAAEPAATEQQPAADQQTAAAAQPAQAQTTAQQPQAATQAAAGGQQAQPQQQQQMAAASTPEKSKPEAFRGGVKNRGKIGRLLTDEDW